LKAAIRPGLDVRSAQAGSGQATQARDRTIEEEGDSVTTTVRRDYPSKESGEFSHSMLVRTALTFRDTSHCD